MALRADLQTLEADGLLRQRVARGPAEPPFVELDGEQVLSFAGNDYLGLSHHPLARQAFSEAAARYGVGSGASPHVSGYTRPHRRLEQELALFTGRDRALLFGSGYAANLAVLDTLSDRHDRLYQDRLNHASLIDAGRLSRARMQRYAHADTRQLARLLCRPLSGGRRWVVSDAVFSMDGDVAPLQRLSALARDADAVLMVDDAHGFGVLGQGGRGTLDALSLGQDEVPVMVATLGKALGVAGAFVAGPAVLMDTLEQRARPLIYSTAPPPAQAAATLATLALLRSDSGPQARLAGNIAHFRRLAGEAGLSVLPSQTAIQPLMLGCSRHAVALAARLRQHGLLVPAIRPPTVPAGSARLRISLSACHEARHLERLVDTLYRLQPVTRPAPVATA